MNYQHRYYLTENELNLNAHVSIKVIIEQSMSSATSKIRRCSKTHLLVSFFCKAIVCLVALNTVNLEFALPVRPIASI